MLNPDRIVLLGAYIKLQVAQLLITSLLQGTELKDELFVALRLVAKFRFEFPDTALLFIFALSQVVDLPFIEIGEILLDMGQLLGLAVLELFHLT